MSIVLKEKSQNIVIKENSKKQIIWEISPLSPELDANIVRRENSTKSPLENSPLSPPWTTAVVFVLIILFYVIMKIGLNS